MIEFSSEFLIRTFIKIFLLTALVYILVFTLLFFRDVFVKKKSNSKDPSVIQALSLFNKLSVFSSYGFLIAGIINVIINALSGFKPDWRLVIFGIILFFIGLGFNKAKNSLEENKNS